MKIVVVGAKGMLGTDALAACRAAGMETVGLDLPEFDITDREQVCEGLPTADWVLNCAAYTQVDLAETERDAAHRVNATGAQHVAEASARIGARLIYMSTDYVFDGTKQTPYVEDDAPNPLSWYGQTKLEGERVSRAACEATLVVRTQSLFGVHGRNFVATIARLLKEGKPLRVVGDQTHCPTYTGHLAEALVALMQTGKTGTVHVASSSSCTWFEFARAIAERVKPDADITPITAAEYGAAAPRPPHSVLSTARYIEWTGKTMPTWPAALAAYFEALHEQNGLA